MFNYVMDIFKLHVFQHDKWSGAVLNLVQALVLNIFWSTNNIYSFTFRFYLFKK